MISPFEGLYSDTHFFIVRHGESAGNKEGRIQGHTDLPLTEKGIAHASLTGKWFKTHAIDYMVASPLERAIQTAQAIANECGYPIHDIATSKDILELDTGDFSNRTFDEIRIQEPELYQRFQAQSWSAVPHAESVQEIQMRARDHWQSLVEKANEGKKHLLTVTHYGFLQWLYKASFGVQFTSWMPLVSVGNCGVFHCFVSPRQANGETHYYCEWRLINYPAALMFEHNISLTTKPHSI